MNGRQFSGGPAPHMPAKVTVSSVMRRVLYALIPGIAAHVWFFGPGIILQILLASIFALGFEALMLRLRGKPLAPFMSDFSAVVTAVLFALCIPPLAPWWIALIGMGFAIVIAKHLYGGLGHNVFNPAMVGYVVVLISFPATMTQWFLPVPVSGSWPDLGVVFQAILGGQLPMNWDAISQATPLDTIKTGLETGRSLSDITQAPIFGYWGGIGWGWIAAAYLAGGLYLLQQRVIAWQVPASLTGTVVLVSGVAWIFSPGSNTSPMDQLFAGAIMLGAFFIATDPVSGCTSSKGRLWFGAGVGLLTLVIRYWGGYPDGLAFAVLLMNMAAPLIDRYTRPRVYGT